MEDVCKIILKIKLVKKIVVIVFIILSFFSCGTTGKIGFYDFNAPKTEIENQLYKIIGDSSEYAIPLKWKIHTEGDYFERYYIYFREGPEELYQIGFTCDSLEWATSPVSKLALVAVFQEGTQFHYNSDLSYNERMRVQVRFETEIISKIKYTAVKNDNTPRCAGY